MAQATPFGPNAPNDITGAMTVATFNLTVPAGDTLLSTIFNSGICRRIYCNGAGTLFLSRTGDSLNYYSYTVTASQYLDGEFAAIGGTTRGSTALSLILEM